jgi:hypothetical protein
MNAQTSPTVARETVNYQLPSGRIVAIHRDVARDAGYVWFTESNGETVMAVIAAGERERLRGTFWN